MAIQIFHSDQGSVKTLYHDGTTFFSGADAARCLGHSNPQREIRKVVLEEDRVELGFLMGSGRKDDRSIYITEPGLYALIFSSRTPESLSFKRWVCQDLLPRVRKASMAQCHAPLALRNEADLHHKVVDFIRCFYKHALVVPGLGELQDNESRRKYGWSCGYKGGQPDILILHHHARFSGFAIELKHPAGRGVVSDKQVAFLEQLRRAGYKTLLTYSYDLCVKELVEYFQQVRICCPECSCKFKSEQSLTAHLAHFHKIN